MSGSPTILITWPRFDPDDEHTAGRIRAAGYEVRHAAKLGPRSPEELIGLLSGVVGAIVSTDPFTAEVFEACRDLRVVARTGVGLDTIDLDAASAAGVTIMSTPGANHNACADHTLALMLGVIRRLRENDAAVRRKEWDRAGRFSGGELTGANVGLVGFGRIGQAVARRLGGFEATVWVYDPEIESADGHRLVSLEELMSRSDVVSIHCPLTNATRGLIGEREFSLAKSRLILVNTARGEIVDEQALIAAIRSGAVAGAGLDVFAVEPPSSSEFLEMENVILSPHIGGLSEKSMAMMLDQAIDGVLSKLGVDGITATKRMN